MVLFSYHSFFDKVWSWTSAQIWGTSNTLNLIFSNDKALRTETLSWKHSLSVFNVLLNCYIRPRGGNNIFSVLTIWSLTIFGIPTSRVSRKGHSFQFQCLFLGQLSHIQTKKGYFVNLLCFQGGSSPFCGQRKLSSCAGGILIGLPQF